MSPSIEILDDNQLASLAASECQETFGLLQDHHSRGVTRALALFARYDRNIIDDLTQEVFIGVIKDFRSYKPDKPFCNWLYTVAINVGQPHALPRENQAGECRGARTPPDRRATRAGHGSCWASRR